MRHYDGRTWGESAYLLAVFHKEWTIISKNRENFHQKTVIFTNDTSLSELQQEEIFF